MSKSLGVLGLYTYASRFIEQFSERTKHLRELLQKHKKFIWNDNHQQEFDKLKETLTSTSVLKFYDPSKSVELHTDASEFSIGAVLVQSDENNHKRPISYTSRSLSRREQNYGPTERETLALVWSIDKLQMYLYGKQFDVVVDHQALKFIFNPRSKLNAKIFRWQLQRQRTYCRLCFKNTQRKKGGGVG